MFVFAHLSDVHLDGTAQIADRTARVMSCLGRLTGPIDCVLVTGDIADHGADVEYEEARKALSYSRPVLFCPGNHDDRRSLRLSLFGESDVEFLDDAPINEIHVINGVTFAMCDSSIPGRNEGVLTDETLRWLGMELDRARGPVFVCLHHPPVALHQPYVDRIGLQEPDRLADLIRRHDNVVAVLCGHAHTPAATTFAGKPLLVAPGVKSSLLLPWESEQPATMELPPAFAFHILDDEGRLTTHYRFV